MSEEPKRKGEVLVVRPMPGANCSSIGSVIDILFVAGTACGVLLVAATAALRDEPIEIAGEDEEGDARPD